jgi:hypothetical protein
VQRQTGQTLVDYLRPRLFEPLGIRDAFWMEEPAGRNLGFSGLHATTDAIHRLEPVVENTVTRPTLRFVEIAGQWIQTLQMGDIRLYCLYIIITLAILLIVLFGRSGL